MNSRTPTLAEAYYGHICTDLIGCIACRLDGLEPVEPNATWVSFHHNTKKGSSKPGCHFFAMGLCHHHHQGGEGGDNTPARHREEWLFKKLYGSDIELGRRNWALIGALPLEIRTSHQVGDVMAYCPFEELRINAGFTS